MFTHFKIGLFLIFSVSCYAEINEWSGSDYARNSSVQLSHAERLLNGIYLEGNEKILDIGCGDGKITALIAKRVLQGYVIGIDPSTSMLFKTEEHQSSNLSFFQNSAESFLFHEKFDHIFAIHVMHWIEDQRKALKNIYLHLKPGGAVHFILAPSKEGLPFHKALQKTLDIWENEFSGFINPQQVYDIESYRKLMVNAGFHIESIHYVFHESIHDNMEKLKFWIKQWLPHRKYLPEKKQDIFLDELLRNYLIEAGYNLDTSGSIKWGEYVLIIEGQRLK